MKTPLTRVHPYDPTHSMDIIKINMLKTFNLNAFSQYFGVHYRLDFIDLSSSRECSLDQPASINSRFSSVDDNHMQSLTAAGIRLGD